VKRALILLALLAVGCAAHRPPAYPASLPVCGRAEPKPVNGSLQCRTKTQREDDVPWPSCERNAQRHCYHGAGVTDSVDVWVYVP
jgi:hypothetical protein